jgi:UrcA family protein
MTNHKPVTLLASVALAVGGLAATSSPAVGQGQRLEVVAEQPNPTRSVRYSDLNLASAEGEKILNRRVASAVSRVCLEAIGHNLDLQSNQACRFSAWAGAKPQITRAVERAREIAVTGSSNIAAVAITLAAK